MPYRGRRISSFVLAVPVVLIFTPSLYASLNLNIGGFDDTNGLISYAGGRSPLTGSFDGEMPISLPLSPFGYSSIIGGAQFSTGPLVGHDATDWFFADGGSLSLAGSVLYSCQSSCQVLPFTTLLTAKLFDTSVTEDCDPSCQDTPGSYSFFEIHSQISAMINPEFAKLLGLPGGLYSGTILFITPSAPALAPPNPFSYGDGKYENFNLTPISAVPEPISVTLLATVLVFFLVRLHRNKGRYHQALGVNGKSG